MAEIISFSLGVRIRVRGLDKNRYGCILSIGGYEKRPSGLCGCSQVTGQSRSTSRSSKSTLRKNKMSKHQGRILSGARPFNLLPFRKLRWFQTRQRRTRCAHCAPQNQWISLAQAKTDFPKLGLVSCMVRRAGLEPAIPDGWEIYSLLQ